MPYTMQSDYSETSNLLMGSNQPRYSYQVAGGFQAYRRLKQLQCCITILILCAVAVTLALAISFNYNADVKEKENPAKDSFENGSSVSLILSWPIPDVPQTDFCVNDFNEWQLALNAGETALFERDEIEKISPSLLQNSPSDKHMKSFITLETSRILSRIAYVNENAQKYLFRKGNITKICRAASIPRRHSVNNHPCNRFYKYRSYDGTCNNLAHPEEFGVQLTSFRRALPPDYADGISKPRISKSGDSLPSARSISVKVHRPLYKNDNKFTVMLAVWGQFIDHDITATALSTKAEGKTISCCSSIIHPECFPISIELNDPYYSKYNITCMEFVRSAPAPKNVLGPRQQLNQATSFLDGSVVYGSHINVTQTLREFINGTLKMHRTSNNRTLLPINTYPSDGCNMEQQIKRGRYCFLSGDQRANENLLLTSMHLIWARQHNTLASALKKINSHWKDERLFQEARHILSAQIQHITYNEFLKNILDAKLYKDLDLSPKPDRYFFQDYDSSIDVSVANNFAASAFRFGHTLIPSLLKFLGNSTTQPEYQQLHRMLFNPFQLYEFDGLDKSIRGALNTSVEASDTYFNNEIKSHLFENLKVNSHTLCGLDLVSLNIQRGRDHGLPGYIKWRQHCGLKRPGRFEDLSEDIDKLSLTNIRNIYRYLEDIDLYTGAISEKPLKGGLLGPTFTCLIVDQFIRLKKGDRMWYENPGIFTKEQLTEIRSTSLAGVLCDNSDNLDHVQTYVMRRISKNNKYTPCMAIARPDLTKWKEANLPHIHISDNSISIKPASNLKQFYNSST